MTSPSASAFAGFRFPREVISIAVRWYLRDPATDEISGTVKVLKDGCGPGGNLTFTSGAVWYACRGYPLLWKIDPATLRVVQKIRIGGSEEGDAFYGYTGPGYREEFWILDADGTRLMIAAGRSPGSPPKNLAELRAIVDSLRIEPEGDEESRRRRTLSGTGERR